MDRLISDVLIGLAHAPLGGVHRPRSTEALFPARVTAMGHRGAAGLAPENTMAAFRAAAALGVPFELDVRQAACGALIVFHDETLWRLTGASGRPEERSLAELRRLDAGAHFSGRAGGFAGEVIPSFDEVLAAFGDQVVMNVEIKAGRGVDPGPLAAAAVAAIRRHGLARSVLITSFNPFVLAAVRADAPELRRGQIVGSFAGAGLRWHERALLRSLALNHRALPDVLSVEHSLITARSLQTMQGRGYRVFAWTVNDAAEIERLVALGVDGIISDRPDLVLATTGR